MVVYDLGGGTFDTAAVSLEGRRFELIASEGVAQLGGDDFDEIIFHGTDPTNEDSDGDEIPDSEEGGDDTDGDEIGRASCRERV